MTTPAEWLASHRAFISEVGEDVIVRRYAGTGAARVPTDVVTKARVMGYAPTQIVGAVVQGDRKLVMLIDTLSALLPLTTDDKVVIRGIETAIMSVDDSTRRPGGTLVALDLVVRGG